jgi:hypothetical protein
MVEIEALVMAVSNRGSLSDRSTRHIPDVPGRAYRPLTDKPQMMAFSKQHR